jgi:hypothetical protein
VILLGVFTGGVGWGLALVVAGGASVATKLGLNALFS